mgnify:CR=1 FL=1
MSIGLAKNPLKVLKGTYEKENLSGSAVMDTLTGWGKTYFPDEADVVVWCMHKIVWGKCQDGILQFMNDENPDIDTVLELRIFNEKAELYAVRAGEEFAGRYIKDEGKQEIHFVDSMARLWGERAKRTGDFVVLKDSNRKLVLTVPCKEDAAYYGLVTRNYIGYAQQNGQAGYIDYRYVKIVSAEEGR